MSIFHDKMSLSGKTALVTGGTGALGRVVAKTLASEGARVIITHRGRIPAGVLPAGVRKSTIALEADVTSEESVSALFRSIATVAKKVDILVNTVGGFMAGGPLSATPTGEWRAMMGTNLDSVFYCCRAFLAQKRVTSYGRIINIAAQTVIRPSAGKVGYAVSKGGVAVLTALLGEELRGSGITANAIAPGTLKTRANIRSMPGADTSGWVDPADVADEIVHLCSPSAGSINGSIIPMLGGA
jgi:NAD(P)-dependent dehydrogenase (short-subunit alcohol dehydrogenase family)